MQFLLNAAAATGNVWQLPFEIPYIVWFQSLGGKGSFLYYLMNFLSLLGEEIVLVGVLGLIYWGIDKKRGEKVGLFMTAAGLLNPLIKGIFRRERPFVAHADKVQNMRDVDGYSFPSGHSTNSASVFFGSAVAFRDKKRKWLWALGAIIPVLVAISRNYCGAHYPTDVVAGLALGVGIVFLADFLFDRVNKYWLFGGVLVLGLAGFFYCTESDFYTGYGLTLGFTCGLLFEQKVTNFKNTKVWWRILLRVAVGGALFLGMNTGLKEIVGLFGKSVVVDGEKMKWFEVDHVWFEHIFRVLRYAVVVFVLVGVYPLLFAQTEKLWKKWHWLETDDTISGKLKKIDDAPQSEPDAPAEPDVAPEQANQGAPEQTDGTQTQE